MFHLLEHLGGQGVGDGDKAGKEIGGSQRQNEQGGRRLVPLLVVDVEGQGVAYDTQHDEDDEHEEKDDELGTVRQACTEDKTIRFLNFESNS